MRAEGRLSNRSSYVTECDNAPVHEMRRGRVLYAEDPAWNAEAYAERGRPGVAWWVYGIECVPNEDTEWSGMVERTGRVVAVMVGDDAPHTFAPDELVPLAEDAYCHVCGQVGCKHDGRGE
jgi:hypothetical protein